MRMRFPKSHVTYYVPAIIISLVGFVVAYQFVDPAPPRQITIATGPASGTYYTMAKRYSRVMARDGVTLNVRETSGSVQNLQLINDRNSGVDVIFMQGGIATDTPSDNLVSLGSVYNEPLWVFHRAELRVQYLSDLIGKRISVGIEGSGTKALAMQLLSFNDVTPDNSRIISIGHSESGRDLLAGKIDAAFFVVAYRADLGLKLFLSPDIRLMSFRRGEAYTNRLHFLSLLKLPEGSLDFSNNFPDKDIYLIAPKAQLVVRKDFHPALIDLLLYAARESGSPAGVFEKEGEFPGPKFIDFPLSKDAKRFYESGPAFLRRILPFWLANLLIRMKILLLPLIALVYPLIKLLPPFYNWRMHYRIYRWYDQLMTIDSEMLKGDIILRREEFMSRLNTIEYSLLQISVPLRFSRDLYDMRIHIEMLREKLLSAGADDYKKCSRHMEEKNDITASGTDLNDPIVTDHNKR